MKYIKKILFIVIGFLLFIPSVFADNNKNLVNIYMFYSDSCHHCSNEIKMFSDLEKIYDNIKIYKYEVSNRDNFLLFEDVSDLYNTEVTGVPCTFIGDKVYKGYNKDDSKRKIKATIEYYSDNGYEDKIGKYLGNVELPYYEINDNSNVDEFIDDYGNHELRFLGLKIETEKLALPVISVLIGLIDGFNPCAMWVLLFLISMLIGMKNKKRMWILGMTFLSTSAFIYLMFMLTWLNVASFLVSFKWFRLLIGLVAIIGSVFNLYGYFKNRKNNGCIVVDDKKRNKIFSRIRKFTSEKNFLIAILGIVVLAFSVNVVELACSAGLPVIFIEILTFNDLNFMEEFLYILLYMFFFLLDDLLVFFIAMRTMEVTGISTKYGKISKLLGGIFLLLIGLLLIFKPNWIMFNF